MVRWCWDRVMKLAAWSASVAIAALDRRRLVIGWTWACVWAIGRAASVLIGSDSREFDSVSSLIHFNLQPTGQIIKKKLNKKVGWKMRTIWRALYYFTSLNFIKGIKKKKLLKNYISLNDDNWNRNSHAKCDWCFYFLFVWSL